MKTHSFAYDVYVFVVLLGIVVVRMSSSECMLTNPMQFLEARSSGSVFFGCIGHGWGGDGIRKKR